jgi:uncharacterized cysteine cluster protein YcgN (CxxCxxCC family)
MALAARSGAVTEEPFWRTKTLGEMTRDEWESLCDGCGKCCLHKLRGKNTPADSGDVLYTDIACKLLDTDSCRCRNYADRRRFVPDCVQLTPEKAGRFGWLPSTCAYRLLAEGKTLAWWHPLVSGSPETVHLAGISVRGRAVSEITVRKAEVLQRIVSWPR